MQQDRYCRSCGQELQPEDQVCAGCGKPVHATAQVPTPEADVPVPPPQQFVTSAQPSLATGQEGRSEDGIRPSGRYSSSSAARSSRASFSPLSGGVSPQGFDLLG